MPDEQINDPITAEVLKKYRAVAKDLHEDAKAACSKHGVAFEEVDIEEVLKMLNDEAEGRASRDEIKGRVDMHVKGKKK